ncbi:hypothetical protein EDD18DRAFT_844824 [Armillaria luteobubalina]|uniref:F-box domain-containing protein n=1 Tax=Armillaria luteobubalina TaxID=153913 RepID=A0AA39PAG4_9AGAR|nr:hypothetical protein EDD18DRAFT_844824 [Armillaria luteobubalina]
MAYIPTMKMDFDTRLAPLLPDYSHAPPDARIIELLQTNTPPTLMERNNFEATLSETPSRIAELDSLIDSTTSLLRYLTNDRNQALENQANAKKILSPSRRLPPEVLTEVLIQCLPLYGGESHPLDPCALLWTLSHVCRQWRAVALDTPELWSRIYLDFVHDQFLNGSRMQEAAFMLGVVLDRARPHDLEVFIWLKDDIYTHPAFPVLLPSVRYWRSLRIFGGSIDLGFLSPCRCFFDRLETATVRGYHRGESETIDTFAVAPRLRSFRKGLDAPFLLPDNLVVFEDSDPFNENTYTTLRYLVNVNTVSLECSPYSNASPKIHLPKLSKLLLRTDRCMLSTAFMTYNRFDHPSLTHITLFFFYGQILPIEAVNAIQSSTVTSLTLMWSSFVPQNYLALDTQPHLSYLFALPNLRCLTVEGCPYINAFLGELSIGPRMNMILSKMSKLVIICGYDLRFSKDVLDMHILVELIQSRRDQGALREFKLTWRQGLVNDDVDTRRRWQQLGAPGGGIQISASIKGLETN